MKFPRILIVEDDAALRELYKTVFEFESFEVLFAGDGEEAVERVKVELPDFILLDIMLPKKSGIEVLREIKEDAKTAKIPVITLTALSDKETKIEAEEFGVVSHHVKALTKISDIVVLVKENLKMVSA